MYVPQLWRRFKKTKCAILQKIIQMSLLIHLFLYSYKEKFLFKRQCSTFIDLGKYSWKQRQDKGQLILLTQMCLFLSNVYFEYDYVCEGCPMAQWLAHYAVVGKIRVQVSPLSLKLVTNAVAICHIKITQPWVVRGRFVESQDSTYQANIIMLSLLHTPHQLRVPLIRVA